MSRKFKRCLITGITGSGGSYLAEHIFKKDKKIKIYGFYRSKGYLNLLKKKHKKKIKFIKLDLTKFRSLRKKINLIKPDVIFHLASNADVRGSFDFPIEHAYNNNLITVNLLESVRKKVLEKENFKKLVLGLFFLSAILETLQLLVPHRSFQLGDLIFNILGVLVAYCVVKIYLLIIK